MKHPWIDHNKPCLYCGIPLDRTGRTNGKNMNYCRYNHCSQKHGFFVKKLEKLVEINTKESLMFREYLLSQMIKRKPMILMKKMLNSYIITKDSKIIQESLAKV